MPARRIVTAALPYANGPAHLGHLVEYTQADIYVRALRARGEEVAFVCASDAHGTPIELNARRLGLAPEKMVTRFHAEQAADFARFDIAFDHFGSTHAPANRALVEQIYARLRAGGHIVEREVDGNWCAQDGRFLPDRFIRGSCPRCSAADQYGDVCERCGATYAPTDLIGPRCSLCGTAPEVRRSNHAFFRLSDPDQVADLRAYIDSGALQPDIANFVRAWIDAGLRDWCISRDGPYFGFAVPDMPGKYFYVWLDAPIGYIAASEVWAAERGLAPDSLWHGPQTRIEHIIGKDIVYFHALFWPAVLRAAGYAQPARIHVHGMLTVDGEKMSKSRGTYIAARTFAEHVEPQALRYYLACKFGAQSDDVDLSLPDFVARVNAELVNKHANLFSRAGQFLSTRLDGRLGELPFSAAAAQAVPAAEAAEAAEDQTRTVSAGTAAAPGSPVAASAASAADTADTADTALLPLARRVVALGRRVEAAFVARELGAAMRDIAAIADIGNEVMQARRPWEQVGRDPEAARLTCTFALNICEALAMYLAPVVPRFAAAAQQVLGRPAGPMDAGRLFAMRGGQMGRHVRLFERIERAAVDRVVAASMPQGSGSSAAGTADTGDTADAAGAAPSPKPQVSHADFARLDLRVGRVLSATPVPKSRKLLRLDVDLGEAEPRQIVAGIALAYPADELVGTELLVAANLAPAKIMGIESRGMIIGVGAGATMSVLCPQRPQPPGTQAS